MKIIHSLSLLGAASLVFSATLSAQNTEGVRENKVTLTEHRHNNSITEFKGTPDDRVFLKTTLGPAKANGERQTVMTTIYRKDAKGRLRSCKIHDGAGKLLFRVRYGYDPNTGRLAQEQMLDAQVKRVDKDGQEAPVRTVYHTYNAQGQANRPIGVVHIAGTTAEKFFSKDESTYVNPMTVNPNARPVGNR
ncbi:hypothetical protein [Persicirhabdus sediminis]|uniref:YD repeat-containing protein n=1 Tax=Persicirhabdus sediminis TaxID=454144 RepID=A0A8J7MCW0_9BACT|nr:hypothetical protein [Persicirhabdus sediminis]MBK1790192.1 hypothetical protein [Persicirhabdus sediminis]